MLLCNMYLSDKSFMLGRNGEDPSGAGRGVGGTTSAGGRRHLPRKQITYSIVVVKNCHGPEISRQVLVVCVMGYIYFSPT